MDTLRRDGYDGASLAEPSAVTGFGKSSLNHHFPAPVGDRFAGDGVHGVASRARSVGADARSRHTSGAARRDAADADGVLRQGSETVPAGALVCKCGWGGARSAYASPVAEWPTLRRSHWRCAVPRPARRPAFPVPRGGVPATTRMILATAAWPRRYPTGESGVADRPPYRATPTMHPHGRWTRNIAPERKRTCSARPGPIGERTGPVVALCCRQSAYPLRPPLVSRRRQLGRAATRRKWESISEPAASVVALNPRQTLAARWGAV